VDRSLSETPKTFYLGDFIVDHQNEGAGNYNRETQKDMNVTQVALNTIQASQALVQTALTVFSAIIGLVAIFGYIGIRSGAISRAEQIANERVNDYIASDEFESSVRSQTNAVVDEIVRERVKDLLLASASDTEAEAQASQTEGSVEPWSDT
jgi:hypothetical protein